jgi:hypothetical protein
VAPELKQVPSKKNPEQMFGVFSANIENLDHFRKSIFPQLALQLPNFLLYLFTPITCSLNNLLIPPAVCA